jgi:hypothetical protein
MLNQIKILLFSSVNTLPLELLKWQRAERMAHRVKKLEKAFHSFNALRHALGVICD